MALTLNTRYGTRAGEPSIDYPTGSFKNKSAPDALDGTPLERDWANDLLGARDAILKAAGIIANGTAETAEASQVLEALNSIYKALATESSSGISRKSTISEAQGLSSDIPFMTPKKLADAFSGANKSNALNGFQKIPGGLIIQWGNILMTSASLVTITYPLAFPNAVFSVSGLANHGGDGSGFFMSLSSGGLAQATAAIYSDTGTVQVGVSGAWMAIGY